MTAGQRRRHGRRGVALQISKWRKYVVVQYRITCKISSRSRSHKVLYMILYLMLPLNVEHIHLIVLLTECWTNWCCWGIYATLKWVIMGSGNAIIWTNYDLISVVHRIFSNAISWSTCNFRSRNCIWKHLLQIATEIFMSKCAKRMFTAAYSLRMQYKML